MNRTKLFFLLVLGATALASSLADDLKTPANWRRGVQLVNYPPQPGDAVMLESAEAFAISSRTLKSPSSSSAPNEPTCQQLDPELDKIAGHFAASSAFRGRR